MEMNISRAKFIIINIATFTVGVAIGLYLMATLHAFVARERAFALCYAAQNMIDKGDEDQAIILLSQAGIEDRESSVSWELLAQVYARQGKNKLALSLYKTALKILDEKGRSRISFAEYSWERKSIQKEIALLTNKSNEHEGQAHPGL